MLLSLRDWTYISTLHGLTDLQIRRLQKVQNSAARLITGSKSSDHVTPVLKQLHWLPVTQRLDYKLLSMIFKTKSNQAPSYMYMMEMVEWRKPLRRLRSGNVDQYKVPQCERSWGDRSFCIAAPLAWNALPSDLKLSSSIRTFQQKLKTLVMNKA